MKKTLPGFLLLLAILASALWAAGGYKFPGDIILNDGSGAAPRLRLQEVGGLEWWLETSGGDVAGIGANDASDISLSLENDGPGLFNLFAGDGAISSTSDIHAWEKLIVGSVIGPDCIERIDGNGPLSDIDCDSAKDTGEINLSEFGIEADVDLQDLQGAVTDAQVPNDITITVDHTRCVNVDPNHSTTNWLFFRANEALTLTGIDCIVDAATSVVLTLRECDSNGGSCADSEAAITCNATNSTEASGIDDTAVDAGDWLRITRGTVTGSPLQAELCVSYTVVG